MISSSFVRVPRIPLNEGTHTLRKLLTLWIALAAIVAVLCPSQQSDARSLLMSDPLPVVAVAGYSGPGDVVTTGWVYWFGLRAFSAATAGTKAANICNSGDANCADVNTLANGNFDVATATGAPLNCGGTGGTCTIKTLYDKSGGTNCTTACDFTQATIASRPTLVFNCINTTLPCINWAGGTGVLASPNLNASFPQPYTLSAVFKNTAGALTDYIANGSGVTIFMEHSANTPSLFAGGFADFTASDSAFHAVQATYNNAAGTNTVSVDGTLSSATPGAQQINTGTLWNFGYNGNGGPVAQTGELGWHSAGFSGTQQTNLCHNQRLYWGTGGSC